MGYWKWKWPIAMYQLLIAVVTTYCKFCVFKEHSFIILQSWKSEIWNAFHWANIRVLAGLYSFLEGPGENSFSCFCQFMEAAHIVWLVAPYGFTSSSSWSLSLTAGLCSASLFQLHLQWSPSLTADSALPSSSHLQGPLRLHCTQGQSRVISPYFKASWLTTLILSAIWIPFTV